MLKCFLRLNPWTITFRSYKMKMAAMNALWFNCRRTMLAISSKLHSGHTSSGKGESQLVHWASFIVQAIAPRWSSVRSKVRDHQKEASMIARRTKALINKTTTKISAAWLLFCLSLLLRIENAERHHPIKSARKKRPDVIRYKYPTHL